MRFTVWHAVPIAVSRAVVERTHTVISRHRIRELRHLLADDDDRKDHWVPGNYVRDTHDLKSLGFIVAVEIENAQFPGGPVKRIYVLWTIAPKMWSSSADSR